MRKYALGGQNYIEFDHFGVLIWRKQSIIEYMQKSLDILNDAEVDILVMTAIFHYLFGYIHPFYDGNGRLSRFISSYYLTEDLDSLIGNRLSYTIQDNMSDYYKVFKVCNDPINRGDVTTFVVMFLGIVKKTEENLLYALAKRHDLYEKYSGVMFEASARDKWDQTTEKLCHMLLISTLLARDGMSKQDLLEELGIKSKTTLNAKLNTLRKYELIEEIKDGRAARYRLDCGRLNVDAG